MKSLDDDQKKVLRHGRFSVLGPPGSGKSNAAEGYVAWQDTPCDVLVRKRMEAKVLVDRGIKGAKTLQKHRYIALGRPEITGKEDLKLLLAGLQEGEESGRPLVIDEGHNYSAEFFAVIEDVWAGKDMVVFHDKYQCCMHDWANAVDDINDELNWRFGITKEIPLIINYRSVPKIVKVLNTIVPRKMTAFSKDEGGYVHIEQCSTAKDELHFIYNALLEGFEDVQILARNSNRCKQISAFLKEHDVPHLLYLSGMREVFSNGIIVQTYHTSQATEHLTVFPTGVTQGILPDWRGGRDEHNLFYVGCSRAMKNLLVSYYDVPSKFITNELRGLSER